MTGSRCARGVPGAMALLLGLMCGAAPTAWGANRALLIGVSAYDNLPAVRQLRGPGNDAALMRDLLLEQGFAERDIAVLADGMPGAGLPTRRAIEAALADLAAAASKGDFVLVHFSGHGSQQPARPAPGLAEPDGLDETILPRDVGRWNGTARTVDGALTDDDLMAALLRIRERGAFVWAVLDSCHSGDITRGAPADEGERDRRIAPHELGVPAAPATRGESGAPRPRAASIRRPGFAPPHGRGGLVVFSAAQSGETTPEMRLPLASLSRQPQGLFTFTLAQAIRQFPRLTYRQLVAQVQHRYQAMGRDRPTPALAGEDVDLDRAVFGGAAGNVSPQWRITTKDGQLIADAGSLQELTAGSVLGLVAQPADPDDRILGFARVMDLGMVHSRLEPVAHAGVGRLTTAELPGTAYGRLMVRQIPVRLKVARPCDARTGAEGRPMPAVAPCITRSKVARTALEQVGTTGSLPVDLVEPGSAEAVVRLAVWDDRLWLLTAGGDLDSRQSPAIRLDRTAAEVADLLADSLQRIARVRNLERVAAGSRPGTSGVKVDFEVQRKGLGNWQKVSAGETLVTASDDRVRFGLMNPGREAVDVTMLFVDARWGIRVAYPPPGSMVSNRLPAASSQPLQVTARVRADGPGATAGTERMLIIAVPAQPQAPEADFSYLAQASLPRERGVSWTPWSRLLEQAVFTPRESRDAALPVSAVVGPELRVLAWRTVAD